MLSVLESGLILQQNMDPHHIPEFPLLLVSTAMTFLAVCYSKICWEWAGTGTNYCPHLYVILTAKYLFFFVSGLADIRLNRYDLIWSEQNRNWVECNWCVFLFCAIFDKKFSTEKHLHKKTPLSPSLVSLFKQK